MGYGSCFGDEVNNMGFGRNSIGFGGNMMGFGIINLLVYAIIIGLIIYAIIYVFKRSGLSKGNEALEKLKMMYIDGEISEEEFEKRKKIIERK